MKIAVSPALVLGLILVVQPASRAQQVTKGTLPGVVNYAHLETTIACAGAIKPSSVAEIKTLGFKSVINLREASENGADVDAEASAAKAAGINYVHVPFNENSPGPMVVENFLSAITDPANVPAFIHCASGNRASAMWAIKRIRVDHWDADRALAEAAELGLTKPSLKAFVLDHAK